jgi:hypothetical protein
MTQILGTLLFCQLNIGAIGEGHVIPLSVSQQDNRRNRVVAYPVVVAPAILVAMYLPHPALTRQEVLLVHVLFADEYIHPLGVVARNCDI